MISRNLVNWSVLVSSNVDDTTTTSTEGGSVYKKFVLKVTPFSGLKVTLLSFFVSQAMLSMKVKGNDYPSISNLHLHLGLPSAQRNSCGV